MDPLGSARVDDLVHVERELAELWSRASSEDDAVVRACMLNLIVRTAPGEPLDRIADDVARFSERYPARALVVARGEGDGEDLHVYASAHCHLGAGGKQICSEQITLEVGSGDDLTDRVPGVLLRLLSGDCPTYLWWRAPGLDSDPLFGPLARMSDRAVVDTTAADDPPRALIQLAGLAADRSWKGHAGDLAWARLEPWREAVASMFDPPALRGFLRGVRSARARVADGATSRVAGAYMLGWLASRLEWEPDDPPGKWKRHDGESVRVGMEPIRDGAVDGLAAVELDCEGEGRRARFEARRTDADTARLTVDVEEACPLPRSLRVAPPDPMTLLLDHVSRRSHDPVHVAALRSAASLLDSEDR